MTSESKAGSETVRPLKKAEAEVVKDRATWDRGEYSEEGYGRLLETCESILKSLDAERERDKELAKQKILREVRKTVGCVHKELQESEGRLTADEKAGAGYAMRTLDQRLKVKIAVLSGEGQAGEGMNP